MNAAPASIPPTTPRSAATLRRIRLLPGRRLACRRLLLCRGGRLLGCGGLLRRDGFLLRRGLLLHVAQSRLEVVEDEPGGRIAARRGRDDRLAVPHHEDAAFAGRHLELRQRALSLFDALRGGKQPSGSLGDLVGTPRISEGRRGDLPRVVEHDRGLDLRGDLGQVGECLLGVHLGLKHKASLTTPTREGHGGSAGVAVDGILTLCESVDATWCRSSTPTGARIWPRCSPTSRCSR